MASDVFWYISFSLPSECVKISHIVSKRSKSFRQSNFCNCSLVGASCLLFFSHELPAILSPSKLPLSLSLWAAMNLVNPWRAALHSPRSTLDYYARNTTMFLASNGRELILCQHDAPHITLSRRFQ